MHVLHLFLCKQFIYSVINHTHRKQIKYQCFILDICLLFTCNFRFQIFLRLMYLFLFSMKPIFYITLSLLLCKMKNCFKVTRFLPGSEGWLSKWGQGLIWGYRQQYLRHEYWRAWFLCSGGTLRLSRRFGWHGSAFYHVLVAKIQ